MYSWSVSFPAARPGSYLLSSSQTATDGCRRPHVLRVACAGFCWHPSFAYENPNKFCNMYSVLFDGYICTYMYRNIFIHMNVHVCVYMYIYIYMYTVYICWMYMRIELYTYISICAAFSFSLSFCLCLSEKQGHHCLACLPVAVSWTLFLCAPATHLDIISSC